MFNLTRDSTYNHQAQLDSKFRSKIDHTLKLNIYFHCLIFFLEIHSQIYSYMR